MINSGMMRERVLLQKPATNRTGMGSANLEWEDVAEVWASVLGLSSREILQAMQANAIVSHKVRIRFFPGIAHTWRMIWRGRELEISSIVEREVRAIHEILVKEVT
jgi:SPP1 family predicted phage head-tail adaptor